MSYIGNPGSPMEPEMFQQQTPRHLQQQLGDTARFKRHRSYFSPPNYQLGENQYGLQSTNSLMTHPLEKTKITFPPVVVTFKSQQQATINELIDDLILKWKNQHGIDLLITARFGHLHSLLVFANDSSTFESLLDPVRWPGELKGMEILVKVPRQLPPEYSLIIQQFHRNWNEEEMLQELKLNYVSLVKLTRMKVKDGSPLNAVRADFKSREEAAAILRLGKIKVGSMIQPVKPYYLPIRINKCMKCLQHDHTTNSCTRPRLCPRCAEEHTLENGCPNKEKCVNCGGDHYSGHSACPIVQEKRRALLEQAQKRKAELLVAVEQRLHQQKNIHNQINSNSYSENPRKPYNQVVSREHDQVPGQNIELTLTAFLNKMERRLEEFSSRVSSQLCDIEKKLNVYVDRQKKQEKIIKEIILPSIQALYRVGVKSPKKSSKQNDLSKLLDEINHLVVDYNRQFDDSSQQSSPDHPNSLLHNASH